MLQEKERKMFHQATNGVKRFPTEVVIEILSNYGVTTIPGTSNMKTTLLQVDEMEMISKHFMSIATLREKKRSF